MKLSAAIGICTAAAALALTLDACTSTTSHVASSIGDRTADRVADRYLATPTPSPQATPSPTPSYVRRTFNAAANSFLKKLGARAIDRYLPTDSGVEGIDQ